MNANILVQIQNTMAQIAGSWGILSFLLILIISITIGELFRKFFKNRFLGALVSIAVFIWISGEVAKGKGIVDILTSMVSSLAFFIAVFIVAVQVFVKKLIAKGQ